MVEMSAMVIHESVTFLESNAHHHCNAGIHFIGKFGIEQAKIRLRRADFRRGPVESAEIQTLLPTIFVHNMEILGP